MSHALIPLQKQPWHSVLSELERAQTAVADASSPSSGSRVNASVVVDRLSAILAELTARLSTNASSFPVPAFSSTRTRVASVLDASSAEADEDKDDEGCSGLDGVWSPGLHVMAIFVVLIASTVGVLFPLIGKWVPALRLPDFAYAVGKAIAIGVMLGVSLIHMLAESAEQFDAPCVPAHFKGMFGGWPFLFAIIAFVLMHALDATIQDVATSWTAHSNRNEAEKVGKGESAEEVGCDETDRDETPDKAALKAGSKQRKSERARRANDAKAQRCVSALMDPNASSAFVQTAPTEPYADAEPADRATALTPTGGNVAPHAYTDSSTSSSPSSVGLPLDARAFCPVHGEEEEPCSATRVCDETDKKAPCPEGTPDCAETAVCFAPHLASHAGDSHAHDEDTHHHHHHHTDNGAAHGHCHGYVAAPDTMPVAQRVVAAIALEFGVTLHSVIIGLTMGITADRELRTLVVALCFHQLFEGVAMGSRLADASFHRGVELALAVLFVVSAPVGTAIGTAVVSSSRTALSGTNFVLTCAIFNAVCSGILLYLTASLLLYDFTADLRRFTAPGAPHRIVKRIVMFAGFWVGAGVMSLIGKWL